MQYFVSQKLRCNSITSTNAPAGTSAINCLVLFVGEVIAVERGGGGACVAGDLLCYQIVDRNNATKVFEECNCASPSPDQQCPSVSCKESLEELVEDVGCCTNSLLYAFFLNECKVNSPGSTLFTQDDLARLFVACNVTYPSACRHPFSLDNKTNSATALFKQGFVPVTVYNIIFIYLLNL